MISYKIIDDTFPDRPKRNGHHTAVRIESTKRHSNY